MMQHGHRKRQEMGFIVRGRERKGVPLVGYLKFIGTFHCVFVFITTCTISYTYTT